MTDKQRVEIRTADGQVLVFQLTEAEWLATVNALGDQAVQGGLVMLSHETGENVLIGTRHVVTARKVLTP